MPVKAGSGQCMTKPNKKISGDSCNLARVTVAQNEKVSEIEERIVRHISKPETETINVENNENCVSLFPTHHTIVALTVLYRIRCIGDKNLLLLRNWITEIF